MPQVHLLTASEHHSTGHYLVRPAKGAGFSVSVDTEGDALPRLQPEDLLLYVDPGPRLFPLGIHSLPALRVAYLIDVHQDLELRLKVAPLFDVLFVAQRDYVREFHRRGFANASWLPLACDPHVHCVSGTPRDLDVAFIGKLGLRGSARYEVLTNVLPKYSTNDFRRYYSPSEMGQVYSRSKIVFNASINGDLNMRAFEAMAAGSLLITDRIRNGLEDLFVEGEHYIGYSTAEEALSQISRFLEDDTARERIARAAQARVLAQHTYAHRWSQIEGIASRGGGRGDSLSPAQATRTYARILDAQRDPLRLLRLIREDGVSFATGFHLLRATARALNAKVPLTPNAIRARMRSR